MSKHLIANNFNLLSLGIFKKISLHNLVDPAYEPVSRIVWLTLLFVGGGIIAALIWLGLFVAGLLVDSSYYRAAVSYNIASFNDWLMTIVSFTFSNVILLAFTSGLLGGITSKLRVTMSFTISREGLREVIKESKTQIENPFISAFRGMFVFVAILALQYISSFSDLGTIGKIKDQTVNETKLEYEKLFLRISGKTEDTVILKLLRSEIQEQLSAINSNRSDSLVVAMIIEAKSKLKELHENDSLKPHEKSKIQALELKIKSLRRSLKVPANVDFAEIGISSFSYFKFAVIVSFLAFVFGYDSRKFAEFLGKIFKDRPNRNGNNDNPELPDKVKSRD